MDGFAGLAEAFGVDVVADPAEDNTFTLEGPLPDPEDVGGTGFFVTLAEQGIETLSVNGTAYTISDGEGNVTAGAAAAAEAMFISLMLNDTVDITVDLPLADGTTAPVTYTFNHVV